MRNEKQPQSMTLLVVVLALLVCAACAPKPMDSPINAASVPSQASDATPAISPTASAPMGAEYREAGIHDP